MNREGVLEAEPEDKLSVLSALAETQLTTRGILPRRSPPTSGFSQAPAGHSTHHPYTVHLSTYTTQPSAPYRNGYNATL